MPAPMDLPPYTHVPGRTPHPESDPAGHSHGRPRTVPDPLDPQRWWLSPAYVRGLTLFNHGYYWEAHEAWEGLWHAAGRRGPTAAFLQGLIHLAAAGVKAREGVAAGVVSHARRAHELLATLPAQSTYAGLELGPLTAMCQRVDTTAAALVLAGADVRPAPLLPLLPGATMPPRPEGDDHG